jgi:hypothetical protein
MKIISIVVLAPLVCLSLNCTSNIAGNSTQTVNPTVAAMLYNPGGSPAANASVHFYKSGSDPRSASSDSTETDSHGNYTANLDTGVYNILGNSDSGRAYQDSIRVTRGNPVKPPADTLRAPGAIKGLVRLQPSDDARTVFILFLGMGIWAVPEDSIGNFFVQNMAQGIYRVRILTTLDSYVPKDTTLSVTAGIIDTLSGPIVLQYIGIPVPSGLTINYDTLKQIVNLSWNKPTIGRNLKGYNVYRMNVDSNTTLATINLHLVTDTTYSDSTGVQDQTYEYRIAAVDTSETEGVKSAVDSMKVVSGYRFIRAIGSQGTGDGQFISLQGIAVDSGGHIYTADQIPVGTIPRIQKFDSAGIFLKRWGMFGSDTGQLNGIAEISVYKDSLLYVVDPGNSRIATFDLNGNFTFQFPVGGIPSYNYQPFSIAILDTMLFVTDKQVSEIYKYTIRGDSLTEWGFPIYSPGSRGLVTVSVGGSVYFKQNLDIIYVYNASGTLLKQLQLPPSVTDNNGIAVETGGDIFISDFNLNVVWEIDANGNLVGRFAVQQPGKIAVDSHGKIYVSSQDTKIQVFIK